MAWAKRMTRGTRALVAVAILLLIVAVGVVVLARTSEAEITGNEAAGAGAAALEAANGGEVVSIERSDDEGAAWSVEVVQGEQEIDVALDPDFEPLRLEGEPADEDDDDVQHGAIAEQFEYRRGVREELREDRQVEGPERRRAEEAAVAHAGSGRVIYVERSEDPGEAYEVEMLREGVEVDVALDHRFEPVPNERYDD